MKTKTINVYTFDELSEEAKQKAIDNYRNSGMDYFWGNDNEKTLNEFAGIFPITINNWQYGGCRGDINFHMTCDDEIIELKGIRLLKYLYNNYEHWLFKGKYYQSFCCEKEKDIKHHPRLKNEQLSNGKYFQSYYSKLQKDTCCVLTGYCIDDDILNPIYEFLKKPTDNINFEDLMQDCLDSWIKACSDDYEYQQSDEAISEHLEANEYEYDETGIEFKLLI